MAELLQVAQAASSLDYLDDGALDGLGDVEGDEDDSDSDGEAAAARLIAIARDEDELAVRGARGPPILLSRCRSERGAACSRGRCHPPDRSSTRQRWPSACVG